MGDEKSLFAGLDLCRTEAQLTWFDERKMEPESLRVSTEAATAAGEYLIPMVLAVKPGNKEWLFGQEAVRADDKAVKIDRLIERILTGEGFEQEGMSFSPEFLLERYLRKVLSILKGKFPNQTITRLTVTTEDSQPVLISAVYRVLQMLGIGRDRALV